MGKFNLCTASIGICEHAMYEAVTHAHHRMLYGRRVTDFPHVRRELTDARRPPGGDEAVQRPGGRLLPLGRTGRPAVPAVQPDDQDEGHHRGREGHRPALGRHRRQGFRGRQFATPSAPPGSGNRSPPSQARTRCTPDENLRGPLLSALPT
nr:hypothetical protein [Micromonospora sp. WMMC415]